MTFENWHFASFGEIPDVVRWYDSVEPAVSIIILNFNRSDLTKRCMQSVWLHTTKHKYEVVLVDNGSSCQSLSDLSTLDGPHQLIRLNENRFFGEGNNIGVEGSRAPIVVFLNNDTLVTEDWLSPLLGVLNREVRAGAVGPKFLYPDGKLQEAGAYIDQFGKPYQLGKSAIFDRE